MANLERIPFVWTLLVVWWASAMALQPTHSDSRPFGASKSIPWTALSFPNTDATNLRSILPADVLTSLDPSQVTMDPIPSPTTVLAPSSTASASSSFLRSGLMDPAHHHPHGWYPFAAMMQTAAPYIAAHAGQVAVFHIPGNLLLTTPNNLLSDLALAWLLDIKVVLVVGCRYDLDDDPCAVEGPCCTTNTTEDEELVPVDRPHVRSSFPLERMVEESAGYLRTEVERKLNKRLRGHASLAASPIPDLEQGGNVVSGNFYSARRHNAAYAPWGNENEFDLVEDKDRHAEDNTIHDITGSVDHVNAEKIQQALDNNDIVLLTTVSYDSMGNFVHVHGSHLAAAVASALGAYKLVYFATEGSILKHAPSGAMVTELPLRFVQALTQHHHVKASHSLGTTVVTKEETSQALLSDEGETMEMGDSSLPSYAQELLSHLAWARWALEHGVHRAHVVNPMDGALLEELFTSKNGANTCLVQDYEWQRQHRQQLQPPPRPTTATRLDAGSIQDPDDAHDWKKEPSPTRARVKAWSTRTTRRHHHHR